jgi:flagellar hook-basal body complex protein FliE
MRISGIQNAALDKLSQVSDVASGGLSSGGAKGGDDFAKTLMDVMKQVNDTQQNSVQMQNAFMTGQPVDYHDLMIAMEKASVTMELTMAVRNKVLTLIRRSLRCKSSQSRQSSTEGNRRR